jgi:hypothetical protein
MKTKLGVITAVLAFCCALLVGPASQARAEDSCTTQGALALSLADVLEIKATSAQAAADALAQLGVAPVSGWDVDACLTDAVSMEISQSFAALNRESGSYERALAMVQRVPDQVYPDVSPVSPARP